LISGKIKRSWTHILFVFTSNFFVFVDQSLISY
jgi:hypothetical protein